MLEESEENKEQKQQSEEPETKTLSDVNLVELSRDEVPRALAQWFLTQAEQTTKQSIELAKKGYYDLVLTCFGSFLLMVTFMLKVFLGLWGIEIFDQDELFSSSEFIALIGAGTLLVISGAAARVFLYKEKVEQSKKSQENAKQTTAMSWGIEPNVRE